MTLDQVRDYWDARPCNVKHSWVDINEDPLAYSRQVTARKYYVEPHILSFADFPSWCGCRVLELGCGIGTDTIRFAQHGSYITAIDLSPESVEIAIKRVEAEGVGEQVTWLGVENIETYRDTYQEHYDLVYSFGVIHHTPRPSAAVWTANMHLKSGGTFKLMLYHRRSFKVLRILLANFGKLLRWRNIDKVVALESEAQGGCPITYTYTRKKARKLLESLGFSIQEIKVCHIFPYKVEDYIRHRYIRAFPWNVIPRPLFKTLEGIFGWHMCITAVKK